MSDQEPIQGKTESNPLNDVANGGKTNPVFYLLAITTGDPSFDPRKPVSINGYTFVPAPEREAPTVAQPNYTALGLGSAEEAEGRN
jgi:hypothetical protein